MEERVLVVPGSAFGDWWRRLYKSMLCLFYGRPNGSSKKNWKIREKTHVEKGQRFSMDN